MSGPCNAAEASERRRAGKRSGTPCVSAVFNTFPNSCFGQNNGVIQPTGVASRYVGFVVALMLIVLGLFPAVSGLCSAS